MDIILDKKITTFRPHAPQYIDQKKQRAETLREQNKMEIDRQIYTSNCGTLYKLLDDFKGEYTTRLESNDIRVMIKTFFYYQKT